jgi:outer membrane protein OmpA-like peptidoglycan-associated protein
MAATTQTRRYAAAPRLGTVERWFIPALILTAGVHAAIYYVLHVTPFAGFSPPRDTRPPARVFKVNQAVIDPKTLDDKKEDLQQAPAKKPNPDVTDIQIPGEAKPSFEQLMAQAETVIAAPDAEKTMVVEKPKVEPTKSLNKLLAEEDGQQLPSDVKALTDQLLNSKPNVSGSHPSFDVTGTKTGSRPNAGPNQGVPNFSNLDSLLSAKGPLSPKTAPILLPTDLLFDYDSAELRPQAVGSLQKLADLMERNPNATFIIEGHTDSFGPPDYNLRLSLGRAESVKAWLANNAGIDPGRIQTRGYGMTRLLVRGGSVEEQQLNRRVEIVIRNNRAAAAQ